MSLRIALQSIGCLLTVLFLTFPSSVSSGYEPDMWRQFRGENGAGRVDSQEHLQPLSLETQLQWKVEVPAGHSSPIVVADRIFITAFEPNKLSTLCLATSDGSLLWRRDLAVESFETSHPQHGPASPTPVSDGERVFVVFGSYGVVCYQLDGTELWQSRRPIQQNMFGSASSPICVDGKLIVLAGSEQESLLQALDPPTGKVIWERQRPGPASTWSTPVVWRNDRQAMLLFYEPFHLRACSLENGADLWSVPGLADEPVTLPQINGSRIFVTSYNLRTNTEAIGLPTFESLLSECDADRDGMLSVAEAKTNKSILSRPDADGQGDHPLRMFFRFLDEDKNGFIESSEWPKIRKWMEPWEHANGVVAIQVDENGLSPSLDWQQDSGVPECPTPIVLHDRIYMVRNGGTITCLNVNSGDKVFAERAASGGPYYASPVTTGSKIFFASARGVISSIEASDSPQLVSQCQLNEPIWATPAIFDSKLVVRSESHLWLIDMKSKN